MAVPLSGFESRGLWLKVAADHVADAVAVKVAGRLKTAERAPSLRCECSKRADLAVDRTPEIGEAVAVEISRPGRRQPINQMFLAACRRGEQVNDRWIGRKVRIPGELPGHRLIADW